MKTCQIEITPAEIETLFQPNMLEERDAYGNGIMVSAGERFYYASEGKARKGSCPDRVYVSERGSQLIFRGPDYKHWTIYRLCNRMSVKSAMFKEVLRSFRETDNFPWTGLIEPTQEMTDEQICDLWKRTAAIRRNLVRTVVLERRRRSNGSN